MSPHITPRSSTMVWFAKTLITLPWSASWKAKSLEKLSFCDSVGGDWALLLFAHLWGCTGSDYSFHLTHSSAPIDARVSFIGRDQFVNDLYYGAFAFSKMAQKNSKISSCRKIIYPQCSCTKTQQLEFMKTWMSISRVACRNWEGKHWNFSPSSKRCLLANVPFELIF